MNEITSFFQEVTSSDYNKEDDYWKSLLFISATEFGWTQKELLETDIPYLLDILEIRKRNIDKEQAELKRTGSKR